jgi:hypothetical protein
MQLKYIPFILIISIPVFLIGQKSIPGYLGKKNCLSLNYIGGIVKKDPFVSHDQYYSQNPNLQITFERVLNRKKTILLSVSNGGFRVDNEYLYDIFDGDAVKYNNKNYYINSGMIDFKVTTIQLSSQVYFRGNGAIAPLGKYFAYGFSQSFINIKEVNLFYTDYNSSPIKLPKTTHTTTSLSTFFIGFGSKRFLDNNIFINKMIQFNLPFNLYSPPLEPYQVVPTPVLRSDLENDIVKFAFSRQNTLNFTLGIGAAF